jgi:triphosphoribosyl-dephospho-CoA synthase
MSALLGDAAVDALIGELDLTPKPGLVDREHRGAHRDMDAARMEAGAHALGATFAALAATVRGCEPTRALREEVGALGRRGEAAMLRATAGVNTHRGALWALGLLVVAAADGERDADRLCARAATFARLPDRFADRVRRRDDGAFAQARAGFPAIRRVALPALRDPAPHAAARALVGLIATLDDTCLRTRGGRGGVAFAQHAARATRVVDDAALRRLDRAFTARNLSPGGSADLLAAALFLDGIGTA